MGEWLNKNIYPKYGAWSRSKIRKVSGDVWLEDGEIEADLGELVNMFGRNRPGCQDSQCVIDQVGEFVRCEEAARDLRNGQMARWASIDISDIRGAESREKIEETPVRIVNGWQGDLMKMIRGEDQEKSTREGG